MLATSNEIIAAWLNHSRQLSIRVKVNDVTYGSEEITSLSFDSGSISGEVFQIGSSYMNSVQIVFPSIIESIAEDIEVIPELGVIVNGSYEYTKLGHFYVDDFDRNKNNNTTSITATDKMRFMEGEYVSKLTYPKAYREVALDIANSAGVEVNTNSFASLGIGAINKPEGYTHRQAIGLIAQFEGGFASFNRNGELEIRRLAPTTFEITPESYLLKGFTKNESSYRIGGISVKTGEEETDVIRVGSTNGSQVELENKVMTQTLLNQMWELVKTLNYFPYELKWRGCPPLEAGDWIYIEDKDGTKYSVPNLSYSITFNGGMSAESKALTSSTSQATYKYRGSLNQRINYLDSILSSNNWNTNYYNQTEPSNPKEGDIWFKPNGQDTEIWVYKNIDGVLKWVMEISSAVDPDLLQAIENAKKAGQDAQLAAEEAKTAANDAKEVGEAAKQAGEAAWLVANEAKNAAADAKQAGEDAQKVGEDAKSAAENAKSAADDAKAVGENAQLAANDAKQAGENAAILAGQAQETAEQVNDRIGDVVIDIGEIQGDINAIVSEVGDVQTDINKIITDATATTSKANEAFNKASAVEGRTSKLETSVGNIKSTMTDIETDLDSTTKKINEVSTTVDGQTTEIASVKSTATSALSKANTIETTVDGVKTTLTSVQESIAGAEIRNLQLGTQFMTDDMFLNKGNSTFIDYETHRSLRIIQGNTSTNLGLIPVVEGEKLAISFDVRSLGAVAGNRLVLLQWYENETTRKIYTWYDEAYSTDWKRINTVVTVPADVKYFSLGFRAVYNTLEYKLVKISKGTTTKDWSPAPEDLATVTKVNELTTTVDGNTSKISLVETTATSALSKANVAQSTADGNTSKIASVETTATSALSKANVAQSTADGNTTKITSAQSTANSALTKANTAQSTADGNTMTIAAMETEYSHLKNIFPDSDFTKKLSPTNEGTMSYVFNTPGIVLTNTGTGSGSDRTYWGTSLGLVLTVGRTYYVRVYLNTSNAGETVQIGTAGGDNLTYTATTSAATWVEGVIKATQYTAFSIWVARGKSARIREVYIYESTSDISTTKVNQISDTVDGHTQLIASTSTTANSALTKANSVSSTVDGLTVKVTSVEKTANAANTKALQVEATASSLTTTIQNISNAGSNMVTNGGFENSFIGWSGGTRHSIDNTESHTGSKSLKISSGSGTTIISPVVNTFAVIPGRKYEVSYWYKTSADANGNTDNQKLRLANSSGSLLGALAWTGAQTEWAMKSAIFTAGSNIYEWQFSLSANHTTGTVWWDDISIVDVTDRESASTQFTQLATDINLKVSKGDVINQINVGTESILIAGNKLNITAQTTIDNAVIKTANIVDLAVSAAKISDLAVSEGKIGNLAVTNAKIANLSVTEGKIGDAAITNAKIGNLAVSEGKIANLAVTNAKIASLAVTEGKIGDAAITTAKIGNLAVNEGKIADLAVSSAKIANLAVTETKIGDAAITNAKIGNLAVSTVKIADGAIVNAKIGDAAITNAKIADASISSAKIISLDAGKIVASSLAAITTETGTLNVTGWLTMSTENKGMMGTYDFGDGYAAAFNYRWFVGDWRLSHRHLVFTGKIYNVTTSNTRGSYLYDAESFYGNDYLKMRQYNSSATLLNRIDINSNAITMSDEDWGGQSKVIIRANGTADFYNRVQFNLGADVSANTNDIGLRTGRIDAPSNYQSMTLNASRGITDVSFSESNIYFNRTRTVAADLRIGLDGVGKVVLSSAIYDRTYSSSSNLIIQSSGAIGRSTSATKYKLNISEIPDIEDLGLKLLTVEPKSWYDKTGIELAAKDMSDGGLNDVDPITLRPYYGLIAEDLRGAGLDRFLSTNYDTGEIEGIEYDRVWVTLIPVIRNLVQEKVALELRLAKLERQMEGMLYGQDAYH